MATTLILALAVGCDLLLGDPPRWPHPVRLIGAAYTALDALADRFGARTRWYGALGVLLVAACSGALVWWAARLPGVGWLFGLYFAYAGLALGGLLREGRRAARFLEEQNIEAARRVVAGLVSRDVSRLQATELWRALAESVAENANDAFVAPLFWLALCGPGGLWVYKAISTADSMWGYRTDRYVRLGWFGAKADDVLAWLPARLTALALWPAARLLGVGKGVSWRDIRTDARKSASPNAGWPMAAAAWLCGCGMGGPSIYFGKMIEKPRLGPQYGIWNAKHFLLLRRMVFLTGIMIAVVIVFLCNGLLSEAFA